MADTKDTAIKIYSTVWCGYCHQAKAYFDSINLKYTEVDVETDPKEAEAMVKKTNQMGVPVIEIGDEAIIGYNRPKIDELLRKHKLI